MFSVVATFKGSTPKSIQKANNFFLHWFWNTWIYQFYSIFRSVPTSKTGCLWLWNIGQWAMSRSKAILALSQRLTTRRKVTYCSMWERTNQKQSCKFWSLHNVIIEDSCLVDTFFKISGPTHPKVQDHNPEAQNSQKQTSPMTSVKMKFWDINPFWVRVFYTLSKWSPLQKCGVVI